MSVPTANVLYGQYIRNFLMYLAQTRIVRFRWTETILDECFENLKSNRPDLDPSRIEKTKRLMMTNVVDDVIVTGFEGLIDTLELPDPDDRHVLAAAIMCHAQTIMTFNRRDFPPTVLEPLGIKAVRPDEVVLDLIELDPIRVQRALLGLHTSLKKPPMAIEHLLDLFSPDGFTRSMEVLREMLGTID